MNKAESPRAQQIASTPSVFLSYSWSSAEYADRVEQLARDLNSDGIHVVFDQWDLREGQDKNAFMERCVTDQQITRVLILLDPRYAQRANQRKGGVGTETLIISPQVYSQADQQKFIPVVMERNADGSVPLPTYLADRIYVDLSDPETESEHYQRLVRNIFGKPERERPPLGAPPSYLRADAVQLATGRTLTIYKDAVHRGRANPLGYLQDYLDRLILGLTSERIENPSEDPLDEQVVQSIHRFLPYRNEYIELIQFMARHITDTAAYERLHEFFERCLKVRHETLPKGYSWERQSENIAWLTWEMFLCTAAILLENGKFDSLPALLEPYYVESGHSGRGRMRDFSTIDAGFYVIDRIRRDRLKVNYYSLATMIFRERNDERAISFRSLLAADLVLWYRASTSGGHWFPRTLYYGDDADPPGLFVRATSQRFFERLAPALGVSSREAFLQRFQDIPQGDFYEVGNFWGGKDAYGRLLNVEQIATEV